MTKRLEIDGKTEFSQGIINHSDLIEKLSPKRIKTHKDHAVEARLPTMAEYITMTPRLVTPVRILSPQSNGAQSI